MLQRASLAAWLAWSLLAVVAAWAGPGWAQPMPEVPDGGAAAVGQVASEDSGAADSGQTGGDGPARAGGAGSGELREQTIYIPYTKLRGVFEQQGRGVFLPYEQFQSLWEQARRGLPAPVEPARPPAGALITAIENEAVVERDVVRVTARLTVEPLSDGWHELPLRLGNAAILSAKLEGESARLTFRQGAGYSLLLHQGEDRRERLELVLEYAKAYSKSPGQNSVSFQSPQAPLNRWQIKVPEAGVKVNVLPQIAASEVPSGGDDKVTTVLAFVGAANEVRIDWTPKSEGAAGLSALATAEVVQEVLIDEGAARTRAELSYQITRAELTQLVVLVPADQKVAGVYDPNVRQWEVTPAGERQKLTIQLFQPARQSQKLIVELERFHEQGQAMSELVVPAIEAEAVARQSGVVAVRLSEALRAQVLRREGLLQLDKNDLPPRLRQAEWFASYRYATLPFQLALGVEKVQPQVDALELVETYLEPERLSVSLLALYTIQRAGIFQLELEVPAGYEVEQVRGVAAAGAEAVQIDGHQLQPIAAGEPAEGPRRLLVNLASKALGRVALSVDLTRPLDDVNLLTPTGQSSTLAVPIPRTKVATLRRSEGRLIVYTPAGLRVNAADQQGLRSLSFDEALADTTSLRGGRFPRTQPTLAFGFGQDPARLDLKVVRRQPQVNARQFVFAKLDSGVATFEAFFYYDVLYSSVKTLRIDVPAEIAAKLRNVTAGVQEQTLETPQPAPAEGYVAWAFSSDAEFFEHAQLRLTWQEKIDELGIGKTLQLTVPRLVPQGVDRAWGQIAIAKAENLDVGTVGELQGLRPIDHRNDLMEGAPRRDAARAFEFHDDWQLTLAATRYQLQEVKRTSIEQGVLRMVVTRNGQTAVQALYRMRTARQRLEVRLPAGAKLDSTPLRINGRPVALERGLATADQTAAAEGSAGGEAGQGSLNSSYYIPLAGRDTLEDVIVELRYTVDSDQRELELPEFPEEPATQQLHLCVFLPRELALVRSLGPWSDELENKWQTALWDRFAVRISDEELIENLVEGIDYAGDTSFATEGVLHVFSTLQPPAGAAGALRLIAVSTRSLNLMLFGAIGLLGLVLLARPVSHKLAALALVVVAIVLSGVFLPIFSRQLLDANLALALGLMAFVWTVWHVAQLLKRHALAQPPRPREVEEPPAAAGTANGDAGGGRLKHVKMAVGAWSGGGPPEAATAPGDTGGPGGPDDPPAGKLPPSGASPPSAADRQADQAGEGNPDDDQLSGGGRHA